MAKVTITIDTETKTIAAAVDGGETIEGLDQVSISKYMNYNDEEQLEARFFKAEKRGDMRVMTSYCMAKVNDEIKIVDSEPNAVAHAQIADFIKRK